MSLAIALISLIVGFQMSVFLGSCTKGKAKKLWEEGEKEHLNAKLKEKYLQVEYHRIK
mgnify:CR=1 FL=1|tara:strand:- start:2185 stop:2358 length:174 start_codon:yes stop_codon:yes gene_type:complete